MSRRRSWIVRAVTASAIVLGGCGDAQNEPCPQRYQDTDGDGFGAGSAALQCSDVGWVDVGGDCDDTNAAIAPGATWLDADGDGFGAGAPVTSCGAGPYASNADDCDDTDPAVAPSAVVEHCDGVDNDCDGDIDEPNASEELCASEPLPSTCTNGACTCVSSIAIDQGTSCDNAIDVGDFPEGGAPFEFSGWFGQQEEVWYRFTFIDSTDVTCDELHVRVAIDDPGAHYVLEHKDACNNTLYTVRDDAGYYSDGREIRIYADVPRGIVPRISAINGDCPCVSSGPVGPGEVACGDQTGELYVRVRKLDPTTPTCAPFTLEITNGVYQSPF